MFTDRSEDTRIKLLCLLKAMCLSGWTRLFQLEAEIQLTLQREIVTRVSNFNLSHNQAKRLIKYCKYFVQFKKKIALSHLGT